MAELTTNNYIHVWATGVVDEYVFFDDTDTDDTLYAVSRAQRIQRTHEYYDDGMKKHPRLRMWRHVPAIRHVPIIAPQLGLGEKAAA